MEFHNGRQPLRHPQSRRCRPRGAGKGYTVNLQGYPLVRGATAAADGARFIRNTGEAPKRACRPTRSLVDRQRRGLGRSLGEASASPEWLQMPEWAWTGVLRLIRRSEWSTKHHLLILCQGLDRQSFQAGSREVLTPPLVCGLKTSQQSQPKKEPVPMVRVCDRTRAWS